MSDFKEYIDHGFVLVPILAGHKGPKGAAAIRWNHKENCISGSDTPTLRSAGLAHAYSGTCAIDVDHYEKAQEWLAERGVSLDELFAAPDSVQLSSGRANRGKLIYSLPEPLCSKKVALFGKNQSALDFRCATSAGLTVQDVLPPSIHPDTGRPYEWQYANDLIGTWRDLPLIPDALHKIWIEELDAAYVGDNVPDKGASVEELRMLLEYQDASMNRDDWVRVGMAIHHETNGDLNGLELWDEWSRKSDKYEGRRDLEASWRSFHDSPNNVTVGMLRQSAVSTADEFPTIEENAAEPDPWATVAQERKARFKLVHVSEVAQRDPPEWLVDQMLPKVDLAMIYGPPSSGKSFIALDLACAVAHGFTWFNKKTEAGPVVWFAAEAAGAMRNRARAYAQAKGIQLETTDLHIMEQQFSLMSNEDADALADVVKGVAPKLIIVDTLAAASAGANENSGEDMNIVLTNCRKMHEATGALILLIHHSGKDAARGARGWSGLHAAVRAEFSVSYDEESESPIRTLKVTKLNDGVAGDKMPFKLNVVSLEFGDEITSCVIEQLDSAMLDKKQQKQLGGTQKIAFKAAYDLAGGDEGSAPLQDVYDAAILELPKPADGKRDMRQRDVERALKKLHEYGYLTFKEDEIYVGSTYDDE